jgi:hypothetical protein
LFFLTAKYAKKKNAEVAKKKDDLKLTNRIIIELEIRKGLDRSAEWKCKTLRALRKLCALCG